MFNFACARVTFWPYCILSFPLYEVGLFWIVRSTFRHPNIFALTSLKSSRSMYNVLSSGTVWWPFDSSAGKFGTWTSVGEPGKFVIVTLIGSNTAIHLRSTKQESFYSKANCPPPVRVWVSQSYDALGSGGSGLVSHDALGWGCGSVSLCTGTGSCKQDDRHDWKHNLPQLPAAGGNH